MSPTSTAPPPVSGPEAGLGRLFFQSGIPGFPQARHFAVRPWGERPGLFYVLECEDVAGLRFVATSPGRFFPSYQPDFGHEVYAALDAEGPEGTVVLVILTPGPRPDGTTANLLGPLVVNARTGHAVQAVLDGPGPDARTPLIGQ